MLKNSNLHNLHLKVVVSRVNIKLEGVGEKKGEKILRRRVARYNWEKRIFFFNFTQQHLNISIKIPFL